MRGVRDGQIRAMIAAAEQQEGWDVHRRPKTGHIMFVAPCGARVLSASTPSDWRGTLNLRARLRRLGLQLPARRG